MRICVCGCEMERSGKVYICPKCGLMSIITEFEPDEDDSSKSDENAQKQS